MLFTGREQALRDVCSWLRTDQGPATLVITGGPGSGKSALLARLFVLADQDQSPRIPAMHRWPQDTRPPVGSIARFVHARDQTPEELLAALCEACGVDTASTPEDLLVKLSGRSEPVTVIVDAIDETRVDGVTRTGNAVPIVDNVLAPLIYAAGRSRLRLLLGTRTDLIRSLGTPATVINLDDPEYFDEDSARRYVQSCLIHLTGDSPYARMEHKQQLWDVADAVAKAAGRSFLVALIFTPSRSLASRDQPADPNDAAWRATLPRLAIDAMRADLQARLGTDADKASDLLLPLAYAQGAGMPWGDLWPALAGALSGTDYSSTDIGWLVEVAGSYITRSYITRSVDDKGVWAHRLCHEALAEHLRAGRNQIADHTTIVKVLSSHTPRLPNGWSDWVNADPYVLAHLATHARRCDGLDSLIEDPRFLLAADQLPLLAELPSAKSPTARAAADAYRRALPRLRSTDVQDHPAYLQLAARCGRAPNLAHAVADAALPLSWTTEWASWRLQPPHQSVAGYADWIRSVAIGQVNDRPAIVSGGDGLLPHRV